MGQKKALVLNNGQIEQLQAGDYIANVDLVIQTNGNAGALVICTPVYQSNNDTVDKAKADAVGTVNVTGFVTNDPSIAAGGNAAIQGEGVLAATTAQWDAVTGTVGGLVKDSFYYLDAANAGKITATPPSAVGQFVKELGIALSTTELKINIGQRIKL